MKDPSGGPDRRSAPRRTLRRTHNPIYACFRLAEVQISSHNRAFVLLVVSADQITKMH